MPKPHGGRGKKQNYKTKPVRIPLPLLAQVEALIEAFHQENEKDFLLPLEGAWWQVLGVAPNASPDVVKQAYRRLVKALHPDRSVRPDAEFRFNAVTKAYQTWRNSAPT
jgi:DnaJ-class molecular chaperone